MVSSYKLCVFFEKGTLISLEIIVLDNLKKKGFAWRSFFVSFSDSVAHNIDLHTSHFNLDHYVGSMNDRSIECRFLQVCLQVSYFSFGLLETGDTPQFYWFHN